VAARHPAGEQPSVEYGNERSVVADTFAGRVHVEWEKGEGAAMTPLGQLPFFIEYLKQGGLFDGWGCGVPAVSDEPERAVEAGYTGDSDVVGAGRASATLTSRRCAAIRSIHHCSGWPRWLARMRCVGP
jgi:hypothetical protein